MKIDKFSKIFSTKEFLKDRYVFSKILQNLDSPELKLYSDEESYIVCNGGGGYPTWIWTIDNFPHSKLKELENILDLYLDSYKESKFIAKKELYDLLVNGSYPNLGDYYFEEGVLVCKYTIKPKEVKGSIRLAKPEDVDTLTEFQVCATKEMKGIDEMTEEEARNFILKSVEYQNLYVWEVSDRIVSMAKYRVIDDFASIGSVYTVARERCKGYVQNLIYELSNIILHEGYTPMLYTDLSYEASNKAYMKVGYENVGYIVEFSCSNKKERIR